VAGVAAGVHLSNRALLTIIFIEILENIVLRAYVVSRSAQRKAERSSTTRKVQIIAPLR
jgi:hypothetical protein